MIEPPADDPAAKTRLDCEPTGGYNVKPGVHVYEYCPFCGHPIDRGTDHQVTISVDA
jgi:hypothetical protein